MRQSGRGMRSLNSNNSFGHNNLNSCYNHNLNHGQINNLSYQPQLIGNIRPKGLECYGGSQLHMQNQSQINSLRENISQSGLLTQPNDV